MHNHSNIHERTTPKLKNEQTSDSNEIEVSRAHRRRGTQSSSPVSPLAKVASAAVAAEVASAKPTGVDGPHRHSSKTPSSTSTPASKLWQRAAGVGGAGGRGGCSTVRHLGFNVVAAIHALHGVSVVQLKEQLDERASRKEEVSTSVCLSV